MHPSTLHSITGKALRLLPPSTSGETQHPYRVRVIIGAGLALFEQLADLIQGQEGQLYLV
ncbi:hypothetical protein D9M71_362260 [compost metagenome]